jgi:hypothetical protein
METEQEKRETQIPMKKQIQKVQTVDAVELSDQISVLRVGNLERLQQLQTSRESLFETPNSFFLVRAGVAFQCLKPKARPETIPALNLELNPDHQVVRVSMTADDLLQFALRNGIRVFELPDSYIIPGPELTMIANKEVKK